MSDPSTAGEEGAGRRTAGIRRTRPTRDETRRRILEAALRVFGEQGIATSSIDAVAAAADLTKGAVYSSFASKTELVMALVEECTLDRVADGAEVAGASDDPAAALSALARSMYAGMHDHPARHRLIAELYTMAGRDPALAAVLRERRLETRRAGARAIEQATERFGLTPVMPAEELTVVLLALSNGLAIESGIDPDAVSADLIADALVALVVGR